MPFGVLLRRRRRREATNGYPSRKGEGLERDEYPYASTIEGGKGAIVAYVPEKENSIQGGYLSILYATLKDGEGFLVIPVPKKKEKEPQPVPENLTEPTAPPVMPLPLSPKPSVRPIPLIPLILQRLLWLPICVPCLDTHNDSPEHPES
jgi:hypothetical protein